MEGHISTKEAAKKLGISARRVGVLIASGRLPAKKVGEGNRATYYIKPEDLELVKDRKPGRPWPKKGKSK